MTNKFLILSVVGVLTFASAAHASGDVTRGKAKSVTCAACHGADGNSASPAFPRLAGQNVDYLAHSLKAYKKGTRKNAMMSPMATPLTESEIEDLAAYFASQTGLQVKK